jgi:2-oxoglutarate ferredoxin oxidoreductase subunit alpha
MSEALDWLEGEGLHLDAMRIRAFPFGDEIMDFITEHDRVFVVEQNRDAQLRFLLINECALDPAKLLSVLHYDGTPITARYISQEIADDIAALEAKPKKRGSSVKGVRS